MILTLIPYDGQTWIIDDGKSYAAVVLDTLLINIRKKISTRGSAIFAS